VGLEAQETHVLDIHIVQMVEMVLQVLILIMVLLEEEAQDQVQMVLEVKVLMHRKVHPQEVQEVLEHI
jgi:hypothetical protein